MARNGSGTYTRPNTFVSGATITAAGHNENWDDLETEMTNSLPRDGQAAMTAPLKIVAGSVSAPGLAFDGDANTGIYRYGSDELGITAGNSLVARFSSAGITSSAGLSGTVLSMSGNASVGGNATVTGTLTLTGAADFNGSMDVAGTFTVAGASPFALINGLTEDTNPDPAADFAATYDTSASAPKKVKLQNLSSFPRGHLWGLTLSNNVSDATNDIDIAAGEARDDANTNDMRLAASLTKRLDASWAVGSGNGGLDTGSIADGTYYIHLIKRTDTGVVDALFSTSATSPTMPTNYDKSRRIGAIIRASGAIRAFKQYDDFFEWVSPSLETNANNPGTSAVLCNVSAPSAFQVRAVLNVVVVNAGASATVAYFSNPSVTDSAPSPSSAPLTLLSEVRTGPGSVTTAGGQLVIVTSSAQIRARLSYSDGNVTLRIATAGYYDPRGRLS